MTPDQLLDMIVANGDTLADIDNAISKLICKIETRINEQPPLFEFFDSTPLIETRGVNSNGHATLRAYRLGIAQVDDLDAANDDGDSPRIIVIKAEAQATDERGNRLVDYTGDPIMETIWIRPLGFCRRSHQREAHLRLPEFLANYAKAARILADHAIASRQNLEAAVTDPTGFSSLTT